MAHEECLVSYLLNRKFCGYLDLSFEDLSSIETLKQDAITYVDSDWNARGLTYAELIYYCQYFHRQLLLHFDAEDADNITIPFTSTPPPSVSLSSKCRLILLIYGDCAQWTPVFMLGANLASKPFFFVDRLEMLHYVLTLNAEQSYFQFNCIVLHKFRLKELQDLLDKQLQLQYRIHPLQSILDYVLVTLKCPPLKSTNSVLSDSTPLKISYVITTSGTTSKRRKLIMVPHRSIISNIIDLTKEYNLTSKDNMLICSPFTFDPSYCDLFLGLCIGASLLLISNSFRNSPLNLKRLKFEDLTYMTITPSLWNRFKLEDIESCILSPRSALRILNFGGEQCPKTIAGLFQLKPSLSIYNLYGLSEMSVWASIFHLNACSLKDCNDSVPILGRPLDSTQVYLNDNNEIIIESNTRQCLIFDGVDWKFDAIINTGDIGYKHQEHVYFSHRREHEESFNLKINGIKCNLREIECLVGEHFKDIAVYACPGDWQHWSSSVVHLYIHNKQDNQDDHLRLKDEILFYLIHTRSMPFAFRVAFIDAFANLSPNGKLDRSKLSNSTPSKYSNDIGEDVFSRIKSIMNVDNMDKTTKLRDLGMSSMSALQIALEIEQVCCASTDAKELSFDGLFDIINASNCEQIINYVLDLMVQAKSQIATTSQHRTEPSNENTPEHDRLCVKRQWSYFMEACVDATPVVVEIDSKVIVCNVCLLSTNVSLQSHLIVASHSGLVVALDIEQTDNLPRMRWSVHLSDRIERDPCLSFNGQLVYIAHLHGSLTCLEVRSGKMVWRSQTADFNKCHPVCISSRWVLCGSYDKHLHCWHQLTGQLEWKLNVDNSAVLSISTEICLDKDPAVLISTAKGTIALVQLTSGEIIWQRTLHLTPIFSAASINQPLACAVIGLVNSSIVCVSLVDGHTRWQHSTQTPVFWPGTQLRMPNEDWAVLFGLNNSQVICLSVSQGTPLWTHSTSSMVKVTPYICPQSDLIVVIEKDGLISFIRKQDGHPFRFRCKQEDGEKFSLAETFSLGHEAFARPVMHKKHLYLGARDNCVHCLSLESSDS